MRNILASATVISVALALFCGVILYGAVDPDVAAPMYAFGLLAGVLWALVVIESLLALLQFSLKTDNIAPFSWIPLDWVRPPIYRGRGGGTYICPNNMAGFLELALGLVLARGILLHRTKGSVEAFTVRRLLIIYVALMAVVGIAVSLSRGG